MNIETVLFDMDGTLIDTNELILESFKHTFNHYGYQFSDQEILTFNGPPLVDTFVGLDSDLADEMIETYRTHNLAHHEQYVKVFPEVIETLEALQRRGIPMGVVSAKMRTGVELGLEITGIRDFFQTIVAVDDVTRAKPHAEPVLKGMKALQGKPESTLMIGDNYHDIEAGHNAGVQTAGVAWTEKGEAHLAQYKPTYMLGIMSDLLKIVN